MIGYITKVNVCVKNYKHNMAKPEYWQKGHLLLEILSMILSLLCGVALFMYGMSLMGDGLKSVAGDKLESFLYKMTNTPLKGLLLGTAVTSVIQSSSATTVMVVGFVLIPA